MHQFPIPSSLELEDDIGVCSAIYQPLAPIYTNESKKASSGRPSRSSSGSYSSTELNFSDLQSTRADLVPSGEVTQQLQADNILSTILRNTRLPTINESAQGEIQEANASQANAEIYSFNQDAHIRFQETPIFRAALQSPFSKFNQSYYTQIYDLFLHRAYKDKFEPLPLSSLPTRYMQKPALYFIGLSLTFREMQQQAASLFFCKLACYVEPFNPRAWDEWISLLKSAGKYLEASIILKTAFLFKPFSSYAIDYLHIGDKAGVPKHQLRGLLRSLKRPCQFEKVAIESAKIQMKNRKLHRGLILLNELCLLGDFRANLSQGIILLAKQFEALGDPCRSKQVLEKAICNGLSKYQGHSLYLQTVIRLAFEASKSGHNCYSFLSESLDYIVHNMSLLTTETRFRFCLQIAEAVVKFDQPLMNHRFADLVFASYRMAEDHCKKGSGYDRAMRQIYFTVLNCLNVCPSAASLSWFPNDNQLKYQENKWLYLNGKEVKKHEFSDWKYYLHYALVGDAEFMKLASQKWGQSGRLMAEWIHVLRAHNKNTLVILKIWRHRIEAVPKSGELWCEGGRIYLDLKEYQNAMKCFEFALHFTPQYGDTFFQMLKIYQREGKLYHCQQLKKSFIVSDPFYGNVLSFLRTENSGTRSFKLSLAEVWSKAEAAIKDSLYQNRGEERQLTACAAYNWAYLHPESLGVRERLFASYEQMENRNTKN